MFLKKINLDGGQKARRNNARRTKPLCEKRKECGGRGSDASDGLWHHAAGNGFPLHGHAGGRLGKARPGGPESRDTTLADSKAEKTRWKQPGKNALPEGLLSRTARRKVGFPNTKIRKRKNRLSGQNPRVAGIAVTLAAFAVHERGSGAAFASLARRIFKNATLRRQRGRP